MEYLKEDDFFETTDISLGATLRCLGCKLEAINREDPSRAVLIFRREKGMDGVIQGFWGHSLQVDPLDYFNCLKEIKTRIYQTG